MERKYYAAGSVIAFIYSLIMFVSFSGASEVGQEVKKLEDNVRSNAGKETIRSAGTNLAIKTEIRDAKAEKESVIDVSGKFTVAKVQFRGDVAFIKELNLSDKITGALIGRSFTEGELVEMVKKYQQDCQKLGYYLATIRKSNDTDPQKGLVILDVDKGRYGSTTFKLVDDPKRKGKHYVSEKQLGKSLGHLKEGETFDYDDFYKSVFQLNSQPDVKADVDLDLNSKIVDGVNHRYANMIFKIKDDLPLHGSAEINNYGTKATGEWRLGSTIQDLNLTKHDDVLSLNIGSSTDLRTLYTLASSYYYPHYLGNGGAFVVYGGYSSIDSKEVVPSVDISGIGWFSGAQASYKLLSTGRHELSAYLGVVYRYVEDTLAFEGTEALPSKVTIIPLSFSLSYAALRPDLIGGRNFVALKTSYDMGGSSDEEFNAVREGARAGYLVENIQMARLQSLSFNSKGGQGNEWLMFMKIDAQLSGGKLIPAEQLAVGGATSVRGYIERELRSDNGVSGTIEIRTPFIDGLFDFMNPWSTKGSRDRWQFITFVDGAYLDSDSSNPIANNNATTLVSAGLGFRTSFRENAQLKFDWGVPLKETQESKSPGSGYVRLQVQF